MKRGTGPDRCYWTRWEDDGKVAEVLIPMCWGTVHYGPEGCTCAVPESQMEQAERGRAAAEAEVLRMRTRLDRQHQRVQAEWNTNKRLRDTVTDLRRQLEGSPQ